MVAVRGTLEWVLAVLQGGLWLLLAAASLHLLRSAAWAFGQPRVDAATAGPEPIAGEAPVVTVQVPLRNEKYVAERVLRAVCALDWPRDRLEVQVLDDSDDETVAIVDRVVAELSGAGHRIAVVRRGGRAGYKAGALVEGLRTARGAYIAIFDADCVPPADFLRRLMPLLLADPGLAFVQARWSFENEGRSLLTRVQALILHALFVVEQARLSARAQPVQFNGTSGVWRRSALEAAGGWLGTGTVSVTEDLDLSYRVQLAGLRGRTIPEVAVRTELPAAMAAFRAQQRRWVRGGGEVLRALGRRLLGGGAPSGARATMLAHLLRHARQPYLVLLTLWLPLVQLGRLAPRFTLPWIWPAIVALVLLAVGAYYAAALHRLGRPARAGFFYAPVVVALSLGLAPLLTLALFEGALSGRAAEFVRTPKIAGNLDATYRPPRSLLAMVEVFIGLSYLALAIHALHLLAWPTVAADLLFAAGFLWVGATSLRIAND
jgi:cellulose synthase/poly-beta-1,6-N-acetylglucosamine synthase-like glycosyltransferase